MDVSPQFLRLLNIRGLSTRDEIDRYLAPSQDDLTHPRNWPQVPEAAQALASAIQAGKKLAVWGDYDADGVTATALVHDVLASHGIPVIPHIPHREQDGYGMNVHGVEQLAAQGCRTLLSVDCGISNHAPIARARELGMEVIVTDHHLPPDRLPPANHIVDPKLSVGTPWPCDDLAGVGVAFYVMALVNRLVDRDWKYGMENVLDLVALGTLSDVMPLTGENRILVWHGVKRMSKQPRPGIAALKEVAGIRAGTVLNSEQIVFGLSPRINAAGRVADARAAFELLITRDWYKARELADTLNACNAQRKSLDQKIITEASDIVREMEGEPHCAGLVLHGKDWQAGVAGIAASKIAEEFHKPTIILCGDGEILKGSGRSYGNFDLHQALTRCRNLLESYGGHKMAAGLKVSLNRLEQFRMAFSRVVEEWTGGQAIYPELKVDGMVSFQEANQTEFLDELMKMEPFGAGNPEPVFVSPNAQLRSIDPLGHKGDSVRLKLDDKTGIMDVKAWGQARHFAHCKPGMTMTIAYTPAFNYYNGTRQIEARMIDWTTPR